MDLKIEQKLRERENAGNLRKLNLSEGRVDFFSNDYLGLARNKELADLITSEFKKYSGKLNGSTGSRLLAGNNQFFVSLEDKLAEIFDAEKCLIFNSGYNANLSILSAVPAKGDTIIYDELIHASLIDGARLSFAKRYSFRHNDLADLKRLLDKSEGEKFVVVESVYSMDGDIAPLKELVELCTAEGAHLIVDEAHSTGVWGNKGDGILCAYGLQKKVFARIYTFGKGMGVHGACIAGSEVLINYLINFARPFIYTTALPLHSLIAIDQSFKYLEKKSILQSALWENVKWFESELSLLKSKIEEVAGESPIQVIKVNGNDTAKKLSSVCLNAGFEVRAILSPTVKEGEERLRICLHSFNKKEDISKLVKVLAEQ